MITGYQVPGTRGASIVAGEERVRIYGEWVPINARRSPTWPCCPRTPTPMNSCAGPGFHPRRPGEVFVVHGNRSRPTRCGAVWTTNSAGEQRFPRPNQVFELWSAPTSGLGALLPGSVGPSWCHACYDRSDAAGPDRSLCAWNRSVLGGPGTGKNTLLIETAAAHIADRLDPASVLLLTGSGRLAAAARGELTARLLGSSIRGRGADGGARAGGALRAQLRLLGAADGRRPRR